MIGVEKLKESPYGKVSFEDKINFQNTKYDIRTVDIVPQCFISLQMGKTKYDIII